VIHASDAWVTASDAAARDQLAVYAPLATISVIASDTA
jgi:hypothetical protein